MLRNLLLQGTFVQYIWIAHFTYELYGHICDHGHSELSQTSVIEMGASKDGVVFIIRTC